MVTRNIASLLAILLALAVKPLLAADDDALDTRSTHKSNIALRLPKDWKTQPRESAHILLAATAPIADSDTTGEYAPGVTITIAPGAAVDGDAQQARLTQEIPDYQPTERPAPLTINGLQAVAFGGTFTRGSLKLRCRQYLLAHDNHIYTLTVTSLASDWDLHIAQVQASVLTFTIDKK